MKIFLKRFTMTLVVVSLCMAGSAFATNGYLTHGIGTKNKGMAGSGLGMPEDAIDIATNPAAAALVGDHMVLGIAMFSPVRKYETTDSQLNGQFGAFTIGPNKIKSDTDYFFIPHIARNFQMNNGNSFGLAFYGRGGMDTTWNGGDGNV